MAVAVVQQLASRSTISGGTSLAATMTATATATAGHRAIIAIRGGGGVATVSVSDTRGHSWTVDAATSSTSPSITIFGAIMGAAPASGPIQSGDTITVTMASTVAGIVGVCIELSGVSQSSPVESIGTPTSQTTKDVVSSGSVTTSGDLLVSAFVSGQTTLTNTTTGWTAFVPSVTSFGYGLATFPNASSGVAQSTTWQLSAGGVGSATEMLVYKVASGAQPPIVDAGPDQTVNAGQTVTLDGSGSSDQNGLTLTYSWTCIAGPHNGQTLSGVNPTFTALDGADIWLLTVSDSSGENASDSVTISTTVSIRQIWDGTEIITMQSVVKKPNGEFL